MHTPWRAFQKSGVFSVILTGATGKRYFNHHYNTPSKKCQVFWDKFWPRWTFRWVPWGKMRNNKGKINWKKWKKWKKCLTNRNRCVIVLRRSTVRQNRWGKIRWGKINRNASVLELADRHVWGACVAWRTGSSPVTRTRIGEQKRCTCKKLRIFGVFSRFRGKNYKGYTVDAFGWFCPIYGLELP